MSTGNEIERERSGSEAETQIFSARLTPYRSLNRTGFLAVMLFLSVVSFVTGLVFLMMGAWPVFGFFGLDVLAIYRAIRLNFYRAQALEEITITPSELRLRRVSHRGHQVEFVFNPLWVQLDQKTHAEFGIEKLYLASRGRKISVGSFLGADEKASFAKALTAALHAAKRGPNFNPVS